jgi:hypothetical protein
MAENETRTINSEKPLRKASVISERIKTIKDVRLMFKLFNISMTEEHVMFNELLEAGFLKMDDEVVEVVEVKKEEG